MPNNVKLNKNRTYVMGLSIIVHQMLNEFGLKEITGEQVSVLIDLLLGAGTIFFRWLADKNSKKAIEAALYTPVPKPK